MVTSPCEYRRFHRLGLTENQTRRLATTAQTFVDLFPPIYAAIAADRGRARAGEKTPDYVLHLSLLNRLLPNSRFVHIIRDGRDVALSVLDWGTPSKGPGKLDLWEYEPVGICALWWHRFVAIGRRRGCRSSREPLLGSAI